MIRCHEDCDLRALIIRARTNRNGLELLMRNISITERDARAVIEYRAELHQLESNTSYIWLEQK